MRKQTHPRLLSRDDYSLPPLLPRNPIHWIDDEKEMRAAVRDIQQEIEIGLDVETTFEEPPRLCTVQLATRKDNYVLDALAGHDLTPVFRLLENPDILKIIHYALFEKWVFENLGVEIHRVFDTFEVSRKLRGRRNRHYHSLAAVCRRELGRTLDKSYQKSDWKRRPLTSGQIRYAALDAEVILTLYDLFTAEMSQLELGI